MKFIIFLLYAVTILMPVKKEETTAVKADINTISAQTGEGIIDTQANDKTVANKTFVVNADAGENEKKLMELYNDTSAANTTDEMFVNRHNLPMILIIE